MTAWILSKNTSTSDMDGSRTRLKKGDTVVGGAWTLTIDIAISNYAPDGDAGMTLGGCLG